MSAPSTPPPEPEPIDPALSFEEAQRELETILERIERADESLTLEESMASYKRGRLLLAHCKAILDRAEQVFTDLTEKSRE